MTAPDFTPDPDPDPGDDLPPLSVVVDILTDVGRTLDEVDELLTLHRRACGDDHHAVARLQEVSLRVGNAWTATMLARRGLRP